MMINLKLLNEIPRPEGWGLWQDTNHHYTCYRRANSGFRIVQVSHELLRRPEGRAILRAQIEPGFEDCLTYLLTGWLPIATAPLDGTAVDILVDGKRVADARYDLDYGWSTEHDDDCYPPTHWRPLPPSLEAE